MKTYNVTIEEHISETFEVEADSLEEAMEIAEKQYYNCEFIIGPNVTARLMQGQDRETDKCTEWIQF